MLYTLLLLVVGLAVAPSRAAHTIHAIPKEHWHRQNAVLSNRNVSMRIALKQRNTENAMVYLSDVCVPALSDPDSPNYGKHYSKEAVVDLFAPTEETIATVSQWLVRKGVPSGAIRLSKSKSWLDFTTSADIIEDMLQTKLYEYRVEASSALHVGAEQYTLPEEISSHIDFVHPAQSTLAGRATTASHDRSELSPAVVKGVVYSSDSIPEHQIEVLAEHPESTQYCDTYITPPCIKAMYSISNGTLNSPQNRLGIFEDDNEAPRQSDLNMFYGLFAPDIPPNTGPETDYIDYGNSRPNATYYAVGEAALDFDMAQPILYPQSTVLFQTKDNFDPSVGHFGIFNQFLDAIDGTYCDMSAFGETGDDPSVDGVTPNEQCGTFKPTTVISISYGWVESAYPANYLERQCLEYLKLGLQGTTVVFASGDGGVAGGHGGQCLGREQDIFNPSAPGTCPYVTAVGATELPSGEGVQSPQIATTPFASGGGFSNVWTSPAYQQGAVSSFFSNYDPGFPFYSTSNGDIPLNGQGVYNRAGRAYPDISAVGLKGVIVIDGDVLLLGGSSMAAPIAAAIFTRINEELIAKGRSTIGFANPVLYRNPAAFTDITIGNQDGGNGTCKGKGFSAVPGWDPVSGLGTPIYPKLLEAFLEASSE